MLESAREALGDPAGLAHALIGDRPVGAIAGVAIGALLAWLVLRLVARRRKPEPVAVPVARPAVAPTLAIPPSSLSEEQYHHLFESSPVATLVCDTRKLRILDANAAALAE